MKQYQNEEEKPNPTRLNVVEIPRLLENYLLIQHRSLERGTPKVDTIFIQKKVE